jgi:DNA-binding transcriptional LysR family regulator
VVLPNWARAVDGWGWLPHLPSVRQARLGDAVTLPTPRSPKVLPPVYVVLHRDAMAIAEVCFIKENAARFAARWSGYIWSKYVPSTPPARRKSPRKEVRREGK